MNVKHAIWYVVDLDEERRFSEGHTLCVIRVGELWVWNVTHAGDLIGSGCAPTRERAKQGAERCAEEHGKQEGKDIS